MGIISNVTVKKADNTTNVTYTGVASSAGDKTPALWRDQAASGVLGVQPTFSMVASPNKTGTYRHVNFKFALPYKVVDPNGLDTAPLGSITADAHWAFPMALPATARAEAVAQFANLLASAIVKAYVESTYAPSGS